MYRSPFPTPSPWFRVRRTYVQYLLIYTLFKELGFLLHQFGNRILQTKYLFSWFQHLCLAFLFFEGCFQEGTCWCVSRALAGWRPLWLLSHLDDKLACTAYSSQVLKELLTQVSQSFRTFFLAIHHGAGLEDREVWFKWVIFFFIFLFLSFLSFFFFLVPQPWHMEVPRLGVKLEL